MTIWFCDSLDFVTILLIPSPKCLILYCHLIAFCDWSYWILRLFFMGHWLKISIISLISSYLVTQYSWNVRKNTHQSKLDDLNTLFEFMLFLKLGTQTQLATLSMTGSFYCYWILWLFGPCPMVVTKSNNACILKSKYHASSEYFSSAQKHPPNHVV